MLSQLDYARPSVACTQQSDAEAVVAALSVGSLVQRTDECGGWLPPTRIVSISEVRESGFGGTYRVIEIELMFGTLGATVDSRSYGERWRKSEVQ